MTVINPNSVAGINSITVQSGNALSVHKADGTLIRTLSESTGISTFSSISVGSATTTNNADKSINIGLGASISSHANNTLSLGTGGDERARLDASGNLIIGSTSANAKLHLASGSSTAVGDATNPALQVGGTTNYRLAAYTSNEQGIIANKNGDDGIAFHTKTASGGSFGEAVRITSVGDVGIGTDTMNAPLTVVNNDNAGYIASFRQKHASNSAQIIIDSPSDSNVRPTSIDLAQAGTVKWSLGQAYASTSSQAFHIATSSLQSNENGSKLIITTSGNTGIGTINPSKTLTIFGASSSSFRISKSGVLAYDHTFDGSSYTIANNNGSAGIPLVLGTKTAGAESVRIDANGRVMIGNTDANSLYAGGDDFVVGTGGATNQGMTIYTGNAQQGIIAFADGTSGGSQQYAGYQIYDHNVDAMLFATQATERVRITGVGSFGVGSSSSTEAMIHLDNSVSTAYDAAATDAQRGGTATLLITNDNGTNNSFAQIAFRNDGTNQSVARIAAVKRSTNSSHLVFVTEHGGTPAERMRINSDGFIGVGGGTPASDPRGQFVINSEKNALTNANCNDPHHFHFCLKNDNDTNGEAIGMCFSASSTVDRVGAAIIHNREGPGSVGDMRFFTCGTEGQTSEAMRINSSQQLMIGTTNVGGGSGGVRLQSPDDGSCRFGTTSGSGTKTLIQFIGNSGNTIVGSISVTTSGTTYSGTSDYRLKENESLISDGITRLKTLKPYRFNFKSDPSVTVDGFFAHEVSSIVPEAITGTKDAVAVQDDVDQGIADAIGEPIYQGIDQAKLVPLLTAALQEAITKIETLETKVAALEGG